jgi:RHS repeat-associated protein
LSQTSYSYDASGNMTARTDPSGTTTYSYDALNRRTKDVLPSGATTTYTYDNAGNLASLTDAGGTVTYTYGAANRLTAVTSPSGAKTTFDYDAEGNRTKTTYPNGVITTQTFDAANRITGITSRDSAGTVLRNFSYTYDALDRLTRALTTRSDGTTADDFQYTYDGAGNRLTKTHNGTTVSSTYNAGNQLTDTAGSSYSYDANGNETAISDGRKSSYNARNQATSISLSSGGTLDMTYAGEGQKERLTAGDTAFAHNVLGVGATATATTSTYYTREASGKLLSLRRGTNEYFYLFDALGSVVALTDSAGKLVNSYRYESYGELLNSVEAVNNPWRFASEYHDPTGLYKMGERYYDPKLGRWTQQDPLDQSRNVKEANRYAYAVNDPVNNVDPTGMAVAPNCVRFTGPNFWSIVVVINYCRSYQRVKAVRRFVIDTQCRGLYPRQRWRVWAPAGLDRLERC